jgi:hypothetical protein
MLRERLHMRVTSAGVVKRQTSVSRASLMIFPGRYALSAARADERRSLSVSMVMGWSQRKQGMPPGSSRSVVSLQSI